ncbi:MAG TPA: AbrB/MazE/SpoVT family DNA-binding domain-containing protein, partial [Methanofastidiosum sp.]|nr:AbrB/MazE/SpoVT family DNA-binding domain-containing protein [Methanofastidiosum sp.]HOC78455.1 AbrB/MazE/SpoVT family DNA-binding domain-containing protein [Methanofastidiosum sp.]HPA48644.1 AbrB/MazE/SpoVT family DNA-binding domain-containing protein [Methanofastidiosum sp.]HQK62159.1 AbrB/MazE/SpoVT family DNA-binding domain-containing protein [Methanofastidiosum sp.]
MEIRKVQITGGSSYVITLPKEWIKSLNIKKNDSLGLLVQNDGTLLVTPDKIMEKKRKIKEYTVDSSTDKTFL